MLYNVKIICNVKLYDSKRIIKNQVKFNSQIINTEKEAEDLLKRRVEILKKRALELYNDKDTYTNIRGVITEYIETNQNVITF